MNYLRYLRYWKQPEFSKLLQWSQCIDILDMLLQQEIRTELEQNEDFANFLNDLQFA